MQVEKILDSTQTAGISYDDDASLEPGQFDLDRQLPITVNISSGRDAILVKNPREQITTFLERERFMIATNVSAITVRALGYSTWADRM